MGIDGFAVDLHFEDLPQAPQVGRALHEGAQTALEYRHRELVAVATQGRMRHGYLVDRLAMARPHHIGPELL